MGILSRSVILGALMAGAYSAQAFEQRTLYFNIPTAGSLPLTSPPTFPPTPTGPSQITEWASYDGATSVDMGLPLGGGADLQIPNLGQLFSILSVPVNLRGSLLSITLNVQYYTTQTFTFTRTTEDGTFTASTSQTLALYDFVSPVPAENPFLPADLSLGTLLTSTLNMNGTATLAGAGDSKTVTDTKTGTPQTLALTSGANFNIAAVQNTPAYFTLPVDFTTQAGAVTGGNAQVQYAPFGATLIGITYTFVPESDLAWGALPLVVGGWLVRRRMIAAKKA